MSEATPHYPLGRRSTGMPLPVDLAQCTFVEAGPIRFAVAARQLTDEIIQAAYPTRDPAETVGGWDDQGPTVHVFGSADGLEHLRFDCFENEPHYHYILNTQGGNIVCRLDDHANGDPIEWAVGRLRDQLPEMLVHAGALKLAEETKTRRSEVLAAVDEVKHLLDQAHQQVAVSS